MSHTESVAESVTELRRRLAPRLVRASVDRRVRTMIELLTGTRFAPSTGAQRVDEVRQLHRFLGDVSDVRQPELDELMRAYGAGDYEVKP